MSDCICQQTPPETWTTHYGAVEPGSTMEWNPDCPVHPPLDGTTPLVAEDRWTKTSFADSTEAAIHHALIEFSLALDDRRQGRTGTMHPDESDIFIEHRRLVRDLATGVKDSDEYLESLS